MALNALEDKVIIQVDAVQETTSSGIILPDTATQQPNIGTVISVGPGRVDNNGNTIPTGIAIGDKVMFNIRAAQRIDYNDEEYLVFLAEHVLAIVG